MIISKEKGRKLGWNLADAVQTIAYTIICR